MGRWTARTIVGVLALSPGCRDDGEPTPAAASTTAGTGAGAGAPTTSAASTTGEAPDEGLGSPDSSGNGDDGQMGECSIWKQDCAVGDKCVPWSEAPDLVPDDIRCCPAVEGGGIHGEDCAVEDYFGSCLDDCAVGHMCFDIDNDGKGTCQKFCKGSPSEPVCDDEETCLIYFAGVPFCFPQCDPLVQDCVDGEGCYPDADVAGGTGFICLPVVSGETVGSSCWLLSNCEPGLLCVSPEFYPECPAFAGCCSAICDITEPDTCDAIVPGTQCLSWYYGGQTPPSADLVNVGACALP